MKKLLLLLVWVLPGCEMILDELKKHRNSDIDGVTTSWRTLQGFKTLGGFILSSNSEKFCRGL